MMTLLRILLIAGLLVNGSPSFAGEALVLPAPGQMVPLSPAFDPALLKGMVVYPKEPFRFDFIVKTGQEQKISQDNIKQLIKYFLAALTIPEGDLWVNLSPYERDRIIPASLGMTVLGKDLLSEDYILKQVTSTLIYPEKDLGKQFWAKIYSQAKTKLGSTHVPVNTFNKVWVLPDKAEIFERNHKVYVTQARLKVMLDADYLAAYKGKTPNQSYASDLIRSIVLPQIEEEVNNGQNFAPLRQMYHSLILARWYKDSIKTSLIAQIYKDKNKLKGIDLSDPQIKEKIYAQYVAAYKKGVFNYIKEEETGTGERIPRKYFSGGLPMHIKELTHASQMPDEMMSAALNVSIKLVPQDSALISQTLEIASTDDIDKNVGMWGLDHFAASNPEKAFLSIKNTPKSILLWIALNEIGFQQEAKANTFNFADLIEAMAHGEYETHERTATFFLNGAKHIKPYVEIKHSNGKISYLMFDQSRLRTVFLNENLYNLFMGRTILKPQHIKDKQSLVALLNEHFRMFDSVQDTFTLTKAGKKKFATYLSDLLDEKTRDFESFLLTPSEHESELQREENYRRQIEADVQETRLREELAQQQANQAKDREQFEANRLKAEAELAKKYHLEREAEHKRLKSIREAELKIRAEERQLNRENEENRIISEQARLRILEKKEKFKKTLDTAFKPFVFSLLGATLLTGGYFGYQSYSVKRAKMQVEQENLLRQQKFLESVKNVGKGDLTTLIESVKLAPYDQINTPLFNSLLYILLDIEHGPNITEQQHKDVLHCLALLLKRGNAFTINYFQRVVFEGNVHKDFLVMTKANELRANLPDFYKTNRDVEIQNQLEIIRKNYEAAKKGTEGLIGLSEQYVQEKISSQKAMPQEDQHMVDKISNLINSQVLTALPIEYETTLKSYRVEIKFPLPKSLLDLSETQTPTSEQLKDIRAYLNKLPLELPLSTPRYNRVVQALKFAINDKSINLNDDHLSIQLMARFIISKNEEAQKFFNEIQTKNFMLASKMRQEMALIRTQTPHVDISEIPYQEELKKFYESGIWKNYLFVGTTNQVSTTNSFDMLKFKDPKFSLFIARFYIGLEKAQAIPALYAMGVNPKDIGMVLGALQNGVIENATSETYLELAKIIQNQNMIDGYRYGAFIFFEEKFYRAGGVSKLLASAFANGYGSVWTPGLNAQAHVKPMTAIDLRKTRIIIETLKPAYRKSSDLKPFIESVKSYKPVGKYDLEDKEALLKLLGDAAMKVDINGGIDLNAINVSSSKETDAYNFDQAQLASLNNIQGFSPVITSITNIPRISALFTNN